MLEVVFNESASVSLRMAQRYGNGDFYLKGHVPGFMFYGGKRPSKEEQEKLKDQWLRKEQEKWEKAVPLGGKGTDIFCFDFVLNLGSIGDSFVEERKHVLKRFSYEAEDTAERRIRTALEQLEVFCQRVKEGEEIRIWFGNNAEELCGMTWLCHELIRRALPCNKVNFIRLPEGKLNSDEVEDHLWCEFAELQTLMEPETIQFHASQWEALMESDAPLRVAVDGCVLSAMEDFYDEIIWREIEKMEDEFSQPKLIGRLLDSGIGIRDSWIGYRLDYFLEVDRLELIAMDHECPWIRVLKRKENGDEQDR